ncbi:hypothetical protein ACHAW5_010083 [Stephanodiscus triporus]|uniref:Uncharacterized protein n=1 Tax=Stephanodiscus triporus TaxID=2934178 RepID=A0ABD3NSJ9_9STRA
MATTSIDKTSSLFSLSSPARLVKGCFVIAEVEDDGIAASTDGCTRVAPNEDNDVVDMSNDPVIATPLKFTLCMPRKKKRMKKTPYKLLSSSSAAVASSSGARRTTHHNNDDGARAYRSPNIAPSPHPSPRPTERYNNLGGISPLL